MVTPKYKEIKIPQDTKDLKNFLEFCKDYSDYEKFVKHHQEAIVKYGKNMVEYSTKILHQHFLKSEEDWLKILSKEDSIKLLENQNINIKPNLFLRCGLTGNFFQINYKKHKYKLESEIGYNNINDVKFEIVNHKLIIKQIYEVSWDFYGFGPNKENRLMYNYANLRFEINLIDYSIIKIDINEQKYQLKMEKWRQENL